MILDKLNKVEVIALLIERDGYRCLYPDCTVEFSAIPDHKWSITIDHIHPQAVGRLQGWTEDEINHIDNLQLMHKACNAKKSDLLYNEDGTLPTRGRVKVPKAERPEHCSLCENGRLLLVDPDTGPEYCPVCERGPQPLQFPRSLKREPRQCDHSTYHCWLCGSGLVDRVPAVQRLAFGP